MSYYKIKRDANHKVVADYLTRFGVEVVEIFDPVDLLCHRQHMTALIEIKKPDSNAIYTRKQIEFIANTRMSIAIVETGEEAFEFMKTGIGLNQKQKDALAGFLTRDLRSKWHHQLIERVLNV